MKRILMLAGLVLAMTGCGKGRAVFLLDATQSPTPAMLTGLETIAAQCPSLIDQRERLRVYAASERSNDASVERDLGSKTSVQYHVEITVPAPGEAYDVGEHCYFDVVPGVGLLTSKRACAKLCDGSAGETGYLLKRL